jgi:hypothetical protein
MLQPLKTRILRSLSCKAPEWMGFHFTRDVLSRKTIPDFT